ncbi:MAG: GNAT family N-acetyltransferase [Acidimicrobiales bacterium]
MEICDIQIRPLEASDTDALRDLFFRLSPQTVYLRFFQPVRRPSETLLHHLADVDHDQREALAAVADGQVIGVARYDRLVDDPSRAEIAVLVEDAWQGRGVGKLLLRKLTARAERDGVTTFTASVLGENQRMLALTRDIAPSRHVTIDHGEWNFEIPLGAPAA